MQDKEKKTEEKKILNDQYKIIKTNKKTINSLTLDVKSSKEKILKITLQTETEVQKIFERTQKDIEHAKKFCLEKLIIDFLPVFDSIDRGFELIQNQKNNKIFKKLLDQFQKICHLLQDLIKSFNIKKINDANIFFNPSIHEAMSIQYTDKIESNKIVNVVQCGYILHDTRLLRPAMVIVSKKQK